MVNETNRVVILGAGKDGSAMIAALREDAPLHIEAVVDKNEQAPGMILAERLGIKTFTDIEEALKASAPCVAFNLTSDEGVEVIAANILGVGSVVGGSASRFIWRLVTDLQQTKDDLEYQATHDALTGLANRYYMLNRLSQELERCKRYDVSCSVIMIDFDNFKEINDKFGHVTGDQALKSISTIISDHLRGADSMARWGGEEFLILLPHTDKKTAVLVANKCLEVVKANPVSSDRHLNISMSFSAGVASIEELDDRDDTNEMVEGLLVIADRRLYQGKHNGRGLIVSVN